MSSITPCTCEFAHHDQNLKKEVEQVNQLPIDEIVTRLDAYSPANIAIMRTEYLNLDQAHKDKAVERLNNLPIPAIIKDFFLQQIVQKSAEPLSSWQKI